MFDGKVLRQKRQAAGLTGTQLGAAAGLTHPYVYNLENGKQVNPSYRVVLTLARLLGCRMEDFAAGARKKESRDAQV